MQGIVHMHISIAHTYFMPWHVDTMTDIYVLHLGPYQLCRSPTITKAEGGLSHKGKIPPSVIFECTKPAMPPRDNVASERYVPNSFTVKLCSLPHVPVHCYYRYVLYCIHMYKRLLLCQIEMGWKPWWHFAQDALSGLLLNTRAFWPKGQHGFSVHFKVVVVNLLLFTHNSQLRSPHFTTYIWFSSAKNC